METKKKYCSFHNTECLVLKPKHFNEKSMDYRFIVNCNGKIHDPAPSIIFNSKHDYLKSRIKDMESKIREFKKQLKKMEEKNKQLYLNLKSQNEK